MLGKILKIVYRIVTLVSIYLIQIYIINNTTFFGINGDLCLMAVVVTTLLDKGYIAYITATLCGLLSDILFVGISCKYIVIYIIVVSVLIGLKKMYKQDSKFAIIVFSVVAVVISEVLMGIFNLFYLRNLVNIFTFLFNVLKQCILNICLTFIIYLAFNLFKKEG